LDGAVKLQMAEETYEETITNIFFICKKVKKLSRAPAT
jgi:hypothetical protein